MKMREILNKESLDCINTWHCTWFVAWC